MEQKGFTVMSNNHFLPFMWVHGESEETYRHMVNVIYNSNIREICVEARPHKDFARDQWWIDLGYIIDEAEKLGMRIWILDDEHFPTGYAAGAALKASTALRRQFLCHRKIKLKGGRKHTFNVKRLAVPDKPKGIIENGMLRYSGADKPENKFDDDKLIVCFAEDQSGNRVDLMPCIKGEQLVWQAPAGSWEMQAVSLSRNAGFHRSYINMLDTESCRLQIEAVYEPHYQHFGDKFGTVIAGFFSDEPELGNGQYTDHYAVLGKEQSLPYSEELADMLSETIGADWLKKIHLLWDNGGDPKETACIRYLYMDCVTKLVSQTFSKQLGQWCTEHGVEYIGHVIEDENQHARVGTSLGHYFRGLKWQTMAGVDDIGGQVQFGGEDFQEKSIMGFTLDGEFYHYALGKLGASLAALNPRMKNRAMCEIFGNYGWKSGIHEQKYLLDHFLVQGINYYVPHAFTCKEYPDKDCPPHFYAQGNNPLYRHFGKLMQYGERMCRLIDGGKADVKVGILYHAEAEWSGKCMLMQKPARILADNQIDYFFVPGDVFTEPEFYQTALESGFTVNGNRFDVFIVPYSQYLPKAVLEGLAAVQKAGCKVLFVDDLPESTCEGGKVPAELTTVVKLDDLLAETLKTAAKTVEIMPASNRIRALHYLGEQEVYMVNNESTAAYHGKLTLPRVASVYEYDAWNDKCYAVDISNGAISVDIDPRKSRVYIVEEAPEITPRMQAAGREIHLKQFHVSTCENKDYPNFTNARQMEAGSSYAKVAPKFSGIIRYETDVELSDVKNVVLEISEAYEGIEVFVNGVSAGLQVVPRYTFDIAYLCKPGNNRIAIEVATTLERKHANFFARRKAAPTGITGDVVLYSM